MLLLFELPDPESLEATLDPENELEELDSEEELDCEVVAVAVIVTVVVVENDVREVVKRWGWRERERKIESEEVDEENEELELRPAVVLVVVDVDDPPEGEPPAAAEGLIEVAGPSIVEPPGDGSPVSARQLSCFVWEATIRVQHVGCYVPRPTLMPAISTPLAFKLRRLWARPRAANNGACASSSRARANATKVKTK